MPRTYEAALKYNMDSYKTMQEQLSNTPIESKPRSDLVLGYLALMLEHQDAITKLVILKSKGSAFALLRPQVESAFRGLWVNLIASDAQVTAIRKDGAEPFPKFRDMANELDNRYSANGLLLGLASHWRTMNGYTHAGIEQLGRRFEDDGNIAPNYSDEMLAELLTVSATVSLAMVIPVLRTIGLHEKAEFMEKWLAEN